ncbi:Nucleotide-binding universal stress protein, UspA family [Haladaptatus litoreus]|uniref:Nucleotide-binding universal stress protein, UspA family n=1 Tax=Haladaptatus litoreus TaxID=553468 RepID=A0A1N6X1F8_9EURY|nr:universal stress protein [Haladaptatus litoreus]SIQ96136.1 Nucleotide-binding universal stress protein, UspA family [Haladaptatus litoreus]
MTRRLLIAVDDSEPARKAVEHVLRLFPKDTIVALHVTDPLGESYGERDDSPEIFDWVRERADEHGATVETVTESGDTAETVVQFSDENDIDQLFVGSHGRSGVSRILLGSVAETLVRNSPVPVTVVR